MQVANVDERCLSVALGHVELVDIKPQRVWVDADLAHRNRPFQQLAELGLSYVAQQWRAAEGAEQTEHHQEDQHADPNALGAP